MDPAHPRAITPPGAGSPGGRPLHLPEDTEWLWAYVDRVFAPVLTPLGLVLALGVTGHVLLTKREVAAATAWIGFTWTAPVWGALFYLMFGINRVVRRAKRLRGDRQPRRPAGEGPVEAVPDHLIPFERAVRRISRRPIEGGTAVATFGNGDEAYPEMLAAIGGATRSVGLSTYIMRDDALSRRFVEALAAAVGRGVAVRVLLDGIGSGYFPPIARTLRAAGVPTALFMHSALPWRMPFLNLRSHKKILVVDGETGFAGGLNIAAQNLLAEKPAHPVADTHFRLAGPVVGQLVDAFGQDWAFAAGESLEGEAWFPALEPAGDLLARVVTSGPDADLEKIRSVLIEACACAHRSIGIMTPYFLPGSEIVTALVMAALRGVEVDIVVPRRSDHRFVDLAMRAHIGPLLDVGVRFWLGPPPFNHSKLMTVDGCWSLVGSANWDMRSLRLNFELDVEIYGEDFAAGIDAIMAAHRVERLRARHLNARPLPVRLRDAGLRLLLPYI